MRALLTGATGFVGSHLRVALEAAGVAPRLGTRDPSRAAARRGAGDWVRLDVHAPETFPAALEGCDVAFYLVHEVGEARDYAAREARAARDFGAAAARSGVRRVVYLGGVAPRSRPSPHLRSRIETGRILADAAPTVELRAGMVVGAGGSSWEMVRRAAARLPLVPAPPLLRHHSWPVALDDTVLALLAAARRDDVEVGIYDIPGPERLRHDRLIRRVADLLGHRPAALGLPPLPAGPVGEIVGLVTGVPRGLTRELVRGLGSDLDPGAAQLWARTRIRPMGFDRMVRLALADGASGASPAPDAVRRIAARIDETGPPAVENRLDA